MFCPNCGAEYSAGFTRCSDCEVALVADPPRPGLSRTAPHRRPPTPPDVSAYVRSPGSPGWLARHALVIFLVLPLVAYAVLAAIDVPLSAADSVVTGLTALLVCWAVGERQDRPTKFGARLGVFVLASLIYAVVLLVPLYASEPRGAWTHLAVRYLPLVLVAGLFVQALLSPNTGLRRLPQPLLRWRAPWYVYAVSLLALPLLAVLVVWLSRHLPGATVDSAGGGVVSSTLRVGLLEALVAGPWAVAWFGYGVPVLLHRWSALATALALGLLSWSSSALWFLIHGDSGWPEVYLNLGSGLALAVIAVRLFQRARGSVWPVLILEGTGAAFLLLNWAGNGFGAGAHSDWTALVVAEAALAVLLVVVGRMWQRPDPVSPAAQPGAKPAKGTPGKLVEEHC